MNIALWIVQAILAIAFVLAGSMKTFLPIGDLADQMIWVADVPELLVRFIGVAEIAGALGLILPSATRILPWLTALAAAGLGVILALAVIFHISRGEFVSIPTSLIILIFAAFVAYGRWKVAPIAARS